MTFSHAASGKRQSKTDAGATTAYEYEELGNLLKVVLSGDVAIDYIVDGQNRRIGKKVNGALTQGFLYQDQLNPVAEDVDTGDVAQRLEYDFFLALCCLYQPVSGYASPTRPTAATMARLRQWWNW